jgi:hypothetical protein
MFRKHPSETPLRSVAPLVASLVVATALVATPGRLNGGTT